MRTAPRVLVTGIAVACALLVACAPAPPAVAPTVPSTAPTPSGTPSAPPVVAPVVVLDAGHNGRNSIERATVNRPVPDGRGGTKACNTTGTETDSGYAEHAFDWDVAQRVQARLVAAGVHVVLTRPDDDGVGPCVDERAAITNRAGAAAAVSIHGDGASTDSRGFHVAYSDPPLNPAQEGPARVLATALRDALRDGGFPVADYSGRDGLSARPDLAWLNLATGPAALVECANMRNPAEAAVVGSPEGRERYAAAITAGVLRFLGK